MFPIRSHTVSISSRHFTSQKLSQHTYITYAKFRLRWIGKKKDIINFNFSFLVYEPQKSKKSMFFLVDQEKYASEIGQTGYAR